MTTIKVEIVGHKGGSQSVALTSPYHPDLPRAARHLGGHWSGERWFFDLRDEAGVRSLAREIYGTDGDDGAELVTVRLRLNAGRTWTDELYWGGRQIARRFSRDSHVQLGDDVVVVTGGFPAHGGSRKNPAVAAEEGTVLEVRDVPAPAALKPCGWAEVELPREIEPTCTVELTASELRALVELAGDLPEVAERAAAALASIEG